MTSRVNTTPVGLQNLLGNINQGKNPADLSEIIAPGVDLYPHWATRKLQDDFAFNNIVPTKGTGLTLTVPEGELWQPVALSFTNEVFDNNEDIGISVGIGPPQLTSSKYIRFATNELVNCGYIADDNFTVATSFPDRFILSGGWRLMGQFEGCNNGNARDVFLQALYVKLTD